MSEIVKATCDEFNRVSGARNVPGPEVLAADKLKVGEVIRIVNHDHSQSPSHTSKQCRLQNTVSVHGHGTLATRHDGADLLIKRIR